MRPVPGARRPPGLKTIAAPLAEVSNDEGAAHARLGLAYALHMWVPVATVLSMALCLDGHLGGDGIDTTGGRVLGLGVFVVYTGDRLLEHGRLWGRAATALWAAVGVASGVIAYLTLTLPPLWSATAALGALSLAYLRLKPIAALKTLIVGMSWTVGCAVLAHAPQPGWQALGQPAAIALLLAVCAGGVLCDLKDAASDRRAGVRSLPVMLGDGGARGVAAVLAIAGAVTALCAGAGAMAACNGAMLLLCPLPGLLQRPVVGPLTVDAALAAPGLYLWTLS